MKSGSQGSGPYHGDRASCCHEGASWYDYDLKSELGIKRSTAPYDSQPLTHLADPSSDTPLHRCCVMFQSIFFHHYEQRINNKGCHLLDPRDLFTSNRVTYEGA